MAGRERASKTDQRGYEADIWGNNVQPPPPGGSGRRKKNQTVLINGIPHVQQTLFTGADLRVPFPDTPVNAVPDRLGATSTPGTLFAKPEEERPETQPALFTPPVSTDQVKPAQEDGADATPIMIQRPREETKEYVHLQLPKYHLLALDDRRETHYVPAVLINFDATWNVAELRPFYEASSTKREQALSRLAQEEDFAKVGGQVHDIEVFARPQEETRGRTAPLSYLQFIMKARQGEGEVFLSGELQPSRHDPEVIALVGYSAVITPDYTQVFDLMQRQLQKNALPEEQVIQEDRPTIRCFLQAMRGSESNAERDREPKAARRGRKAVATV